MTDLDRRAAPRARPFDWDAHYTAQRIDPAVMTAEQFFALPEYSSSQPTGVYIGKQWRSNLNAYTDKPAEWVLREYAEHPTNPRMARTITVDVAALESIKDARDG